VVDTGSFFSIYGQIIILVLIQIGGLGIMSFSILFLFYLRGRLGIGSREIIEETLSTFSNIDVASLLKSVFIFTFTIESIGAVLLTIRFTFSDSLKGYRTDIFVNIVMMLLIISGGLGFIVLYEIMLRSKKGFSFKKLSLHSRTVIFFSFALIVIGAALIFIIEYDVSMKDYSLSSKFLTSLFQSVTARTAGFNTIDIHSFSMPTIFVIVTLMFIGASPASCGGGIKTSTFAVLIAFIRTRIYNTRNVNLFYNTLPIRVVSKAVVIIVFGVISVVVFSFLISIIEMENTSFSQNGTHFIQIFFEVVSAFGTVGLSTGITSDLGTMSRILITLLMLIGRVGPLTIAVAIGSKESEDIKYAEDNILIG
jgi:trk system potassium uptake protein TrkH